jgi:phosphoheptose isomerase
MGVLSLVGPWARECVDEFLDKMQEDQRRMRRFLRAHGSRFKQMGEALAAARQLRSRVFVVGEPPLDALAALVAEDYLTHLPALAIDLTRPAPPSVNPDDDEVLVGRAAAAKQAARHLHAGDVVLALLVDGNDKETRRILESARAKRVTTLVIGGLDAKGAVKRLATARINLPTQGVKTIVESAFVCARILARVSRGVARGGGGEGDGEPLVLATCDTCNERVFHEETERGRSVKCPLCQGTTRVAADATRRAAVTSAPPRPDGASKKRRLKPSVLALPVAKLADDDSEDDPDEATVPAPEAEEPATRTTRSSREGGTLKGDAKVEPRNDAAKGGGGSSREGKVKTGSRSRPEEATTSDAGRVEAEPPKKGKSRTAMPAVEDNLDDLVIDDDLPSTTAPPLRPLTPPPKPTHDAPVGLVSHEQPRPSGRLEPNFGSDIMVGSDVVSAKDAPKGPTVTQSADPYALDDGFLADVEMPGGRGARGGSGSGAGSASASASTAEPGGEPPRRLSSRFTVAECRIRWGRGGFPDDGSPAHELVSLTSARLELVLDPDDEAGSTLQKGDELYLRIEIPAFMEPVLVRGVLSAIRGISGDGRRGGSRVDVEFREVDPVVRRKLARAAESMGAPA